MNQEEQILDTCRIVAVVGLSPDAERPSFRVASYLREQGYRIIPVNPQFSQIMGETCYPELTAIRESVDVVDIFRRAEETPAIVDQAIAIGARAVWMQEGVVNEVAAAKAREAGLLVVMDRCMRKEHLKAVERKNKSGGVVMSKTNDNVEAAFAGESQANRKYLFFAEKAEEEGHKQVARLFRATAEAETVHARNHLRVVKGIMSTSENLRAAISGENHEFTEMYPGFIKQAESESQAKAKNSFDLANKVEELHHGLFQAALSKLEKNQAMEEEPFYVCQICGNTVEGKAPDKCPVCGAPAKMFKRVD